MAFMAKNPTDYALLAQQLESLTAGIPYETANLANSAALLWQMLPDINWVGFYKMEDGALILGPFQGKPACIRLSLDRGVCAAAARTKTTCRVENVHAFPGHIACDSASNSEIVLPIFRNGALWGVLDVDSPLFGRFTPEDQAGLEQCTQIVGRFLEGC